MKFKIELVKTIEAEASSLAEAKEIAARESLGRDGVVGRVALSREDAQKLAQSLVVDGWRIIHEAQALADEYRFYLESGDLTYFPKNLTSEEKGGMGNGIHFYRLSEYVYGGEWLSSSGYKDC